jgi:hypothetical protein
LQTGSPKIDDTTQKLLTAALESNKPTVLRSALDRLYYQPAAGSEGYLVFQPELIPLLFHSDEEVQEAARHYLAYLQVPDAPQVVESLLAVLQDDSRKPDHLAAIRALGTIGPKAATAQPHLEKTFVDDSQDMPVHIAVAFAIDKIEGGQRFRNFLLNSMNNLPDEKAKTKMNLLFNAEQQDANE